MKKVRGAEEVLLFCFSEQSRRHARIRQGTHVPGPDFCRGFNERKGRDFSSKETTFLPGLKKGRPPCLEVLLVHPGPGKDVAEPLSAAPIHDAVSWDLEAGLMHHLDEVFNDLLV